MILPEFENHTVESQGLALNVLAFGHPAERSVLMVHGMRDTAHALTPAVQALLNHASEPMQVFVMENRGHGASQWSDTYSMTSMTLDVYNTLQALCPQGAHVFGHSLGGHLVTRFAALFPEIVKSLMVVEGLGPPERAHEQDERLSLQHERDMLLNRMNVPRSTRTLKDLAEVTQRIARNNPRLDPAEAARLAPHMARETELGLQWAFDSRAGSVFVGVSRDLSERYWRNVQAPVCLVSGMLSHEYWGAELGDGQWSGKFAEGEMEARSRIFPNAEHHWFEQSGHMVHYDEAELLGKLYAAFIDKTQNR